MTLDQAISGASNILFSLLAAQLLGVASFGWFGIAFIVYVMAQGVARALVGEPLLVHPDDAERRPGDALGAGVLVGVAIGGVVGIAGVLALTWAQLLGEALLVLAACLPLVVLQDLGRYLAFATQRPARAVVLDLTWLALMVPSVLVLIWLDLRSLAWFTLIWAGSGAVAGLLALVLSRGHHVRLDLRWIRTTWMFSWRYLISFGASNGSALLGSIGLAAISGAAALGGVRGALLLIGPYVTFQTAVLAHGVVDTARDALGGPELRRLAVRLTTIALVVAGLTIALLLWLPDRFGTAVLGDTWWATEPLLLPACVQVFFLAFTAGARAPIVGARRVRTALAVDLFGVVVLLVLTVVGAALDGASGALWGVASGQAIVAVAWWTVLLPTTRQPPGSTAAPPSPPAPHEEKL